jgi:hypothetical protein
MVATTHMLTPDTQAILLLTGSLGQGRALERHMIKKLSKPVRYVIADNTAQATTLPLFS